MNYLKSSKRLFGFALGIGITLAGQISVHAADIDLLVNDVRFNADTQNVEVVVRNNGTETVAQPHFVALTIGTRVVTAQVALPSAGETALTTFNRYSLNLPITSGYSYVLKATADYSNAIAETNELNNILSKSVLIVSYSRPDYIITDIQDIAGSANLAVQVKNIGTGYLSNPFKVKVFNGALSAEGSLSGISAGGVLSAVVSKAALGMASGGTSLFSAQVDSGAVIPEMNESNNEFSKSVTLSAPATQPDLVPSMASFVTSPSYSFAVTCQNLGTAAGYSYVQVSANGVNKTYYVGSVVQGGSRVIYAAVSDFGIQTVGLYNVTVTVDAYAGIVEGNEINNVQMTSINVHTLPTAGGNTGPNADLTVTDMYISYGSIYVVYKNIGSQSAAGFYIKLVGVNGSSSSIYISGSIASGGTATAAIAASNLGMYGTGQSVTATIDYGNYIYENSETNNSYVESLIYNYGQGS